MTMRTVKIAVVALIVLFTAVRSEAQTPVQLFGHVTLVEGYALTNYNGIHAIVQLRDTPTKSIAVLTSEPRLETLLETALATGNLVAVSGVKLTPPPAPPRGGAWATDVYKINGVILYNMK